MRRHVDAHALAARIAEGDGAAVVCGGGRHHMHELGLIGRRHDHHIRQAGEIGHVESARMGRAIRAHKPRAVDGETHGQILQCDVMHQLIVAALQESGIDRAEGLEPLGGEARRESHRMLFGDAHIEAALGKGFLEEIKPGAGRHGGGDGDDLVVAHCLVDQAFGEDARIGGGVGLGLHLRARDHIERVHPMIFVGGGLGGAIALALLRHHMDEHRPGRHVAHVFQHGQKMVEIMAVDGADIIKAQLFEQGAAGPEAARIFLGLLRLVVEEFRQALGQLLGGLAH